MLVVGILVKQGSTKYDLVQCGTVLCGGILLLHFLLGLALTQAAGYVVTCNMQLAILAVHCLGWNLRRLLDM